MKKDIKTYAKKVISLALCGAMVFTFAACGTKQAAPSAPSADAQMEGALYRAVSEYYGALGYGYCLDEAGGYWEDGIDTSRELLDMESLAAAKLVRQGKLNTVDSYFYAALDAYDLFGMISTAYGGICAVAADKLVAVLGMEKSYDSFSASHSECFEAYADARVIRQREYIKATSAADLKDYVCDQFVEDVAKLSADEILAKWGDEVLTDVGVGGRFMMYFDFESEYDEYYDDAEVALVGALAETGIVGEEAVEAAAVGYAAADGFNWDEFWQASMTLNSAVLGGDTSKVDLSLDDYEAMLAAFDPWQKTIDANNMMFVARYGSIPIWDFVALFDEDKAVEVKNAYEGIEEEHGAIDESSEEPVEEVIGDSLDVVNEE